MTNKETKVDVDVGKIVIENLNDGDDYWLLLAPNMLMVEERPGSMIKIWMRDKFVIV